MSEALAVARYEYRMQIRQLGLWLSLMLVAGIFYWLLVVGLDTIPPQVLSNPWEFGANLALPLILLAPVAAGILVADRFPRDRRMLMDDLLRAVLPTSRSFVLGRYVASLLAVLTPPLVIALPVVIYAAARFSLPELLWKTLVIFLIAVLPSWLFVVAWSLAFPLVMPLRLYQVLFAGFWLWAIAVPRGRLPTINESIVDISGKYASYAFFGFAPPTNLNPPASAGWAILNISLVVLAALVGMAAPCLVKPWQEQRQ
jgi:ABC-2 type transport system permease protein